MDSIKFSEDYSSLFSLPNLKIILLISIVFSIIYSFFDSLLTRKEIYEILIKTVIGGLTIFSSFIFIVVITMLLIGDDREILNFRRLVGLYTITMAIGSPFHIVASITRVLGILRWEFFIFLELLGLGVTLAYIILALNGIIKIKLLKTVIISLFFTIMVFIIKGNFYYPDILASNYMWLTLTLSSAVFISVAVITIFAVDSLGRDKNVSALDAFRGFMAVWLARKNEKLESFFDKLGVKRDILMGLTVFRRKRDGSIKSIWVVSNVHPGPFLNVGSANMSKYISEKMESLVGVDNVSILHGTCSHYNNLTSSREKERLLNWLINNIPQCEKKGGFTIYDKVSDGNIEVICQRNGDVILNIVSTNNFSIDDISYELGLLVYEKYRKIGLKVLTIDAHNSIDKGNKNTPTDVKPWSETGRRILNTIERALSDLKEHDEKNILLGVARTKCNQLTVKDGLGSNGITLYLIKSLKGEHGFLILDSNNLKLGLKDRIKDYLVKKFGLQEFHVLTTDTHEVNAVSPKEGSYPILNENHLNDLVNCIESLYIEAKENLEEVHVCSTADFIKGIKVWGDENYYFLKYLLSHGLRMFKILFNLGLVVASIILLLVTTILI